MVQFAFHQENISNKQCLTEYRPGFYYRFCTGYGHLLGARTVLEGILGANIEHADSGLGVVKGVCFELGLE